MRIAAAVVLYTSTTSILVAWLDQAVPALVLPAAASTLPLFAVSARSSKVLAAVSATILASFMVLALLSVGWFYLPALVLLAALAILDL